MVVLALTNSRFYSQIQSLIYSKLKMRYNMASKNYININTILKNKKVEQSEYRTHFTLMEVYCPDGNHKALIDHIASRINYQCKTHIIQICNIVDDNYVDVSVGLYNDSEAYHFLLSKKTIRLLDENRKDKEFQPIVSRAFQTYMRSVEKLKEIYESKLKQKNDPKTHQSESENKANDKPTNSERRDYSQRKQQKPKPEEQANNSFKSLVQKAKELWIFGIPSQYEYADIEKVFINREIKLIEGRWLVHERMEFLEVILEEPIAIPKIYQELCLKVENFPFITIPKLQSPDQIMVQLSKFVLEITVPTFYQEQSLLQFLDDIGGINIMVRNNSAQDKINKFIIAFNNMGHVEKAKVKLSKEYRDCIFNKKAVLLRIGRIMKFYTFQSLIMELNKIYPKASYF